MPESNEAIKFAKNTKFIVSVYAADVLLGFLILRVRLMDFKITPTRPDGICVRVKLWVETWEDLALLMARLQDADIAADPTALIEEFVKEFVKHAEVITGGPDE